MNFHNVVEIEKELSRNLKEALDLTLDEMLDKLGEIIEDDVYDKYSPIWYDRTNFLSENYENVFEKYFWNNFGKGIGGGIRVNESASFETNPEEFVHGSYTEENGIISTLSLPSYLEILNDPSAINHKNRWNFPRVLPRGQFWDDFIQWADENFDLILRRNFYNITGVELR